MPKIEVKNPSHYLDFEDDGCWQCGGEGYVYMCFEDYACVDPEGGCDLCARRCDICNPRRPAARPKEKSDA